MKKIFLIVALAFSWASAFAQEPVLAAESKEVSGKEAKISNVPQQGSYMPSFKCDGTDGKIRNVILMIGDGMGNGAVASAHFANGGQLTMTNLRSLGYVRTQSGDNFTTDSAASGTAYACGVKTYNGAIGLDLDGKKVKNIPEKVSPKGYACGVISTDDVNGATPSAFFAHQASRKMTAEIWGDIAGSCLNFLSAGDQKVFKKQSEATRKAISEKFTVITEPSADISGAGRVLYLPKSVKPVERGAYLPETTQMAIDFLSKASKKGFFLMVEGARIDKEAHGNRYEGVIGEALDFDKAIEVAIRFAEKDGHTLVVISADHETGGIALKSGNQEPGTVAGVFTSKGHTPCFVPLFAYGPHSRDFACIQENSDVSNKIVALMK